MKKGYQYLLNILLPIFILVALSLLYKKIMCHLGSTSENARFICELQWKDGAFLLFSYSIVKLLSSILDFNSIVKRMLVTLGLYCLSYGLMAFPYLLASFFQPFLVNSFIHILLLILGIEILFLRIFSTRSIYDNKEKSP